MSRKRPCSGADSSVTGRPWRSRVSRRGVVSRFWLGSVADHLLRHLEVPLLLLIALIGLVVAGLVISIGTNLFRVPVRGSLPCIFLGTVLYLLSTLGVGLLISTISANQQQAFLGGFLFTLPAMLLSGIMTPVDSMPRWMQWLTYANPLRYFQEIARANMMKGAGFVDLWTQLLALALFGTVIFGLAAARFRKRTG